MGAGSLCAALFPFGTLRPAVLSRPALHLRGRNTFTLIVPHIKRENMRIKYCLTLLLLCVIHVSAQQKMSTPKLYLNITVDQLRSDFLYEFSELYCDGGF